MSIEDVHHHLIETGLVPEAERVHWLACSFEYREKLERAMECVVTDDEDREELEQTIDRQENRIDDLRSSLDAVERDRDKEHNARGELLRVVEDARALLRQALDGPPSKDARELAKKALSTLETVEL
jgi:predicted  nucleic acid-binding Zn-ribbon protein